ncbi:MAG: hypothetical protein Q4G46_02865 [Propionibacteriaceae bacterium]|nr:hypothetical protein [Propionibacteriaceae bacterium]
MTFPLGRRSLSFRTLSLLAAMACLVAVAACSPTQLGADSRQATLVTDGESLIVGSGTPAEVTSRVSAALFDSAPAAVLVDASADLSTIADANVPVLLIADASDTARTTVAAELDRLGAKTVLALGPDATALAANLTQTIVASPGELPELEHPDGETGTVLITGDTGVSGIAPTTLDVVSATARAAGATLMETASGDPREARESVDALADITPDRVIGIGDGLGDLQQLEARVRAAATGVQLPGGGQLHADKQYIALYGHPGVPVLGVLGEQNLDASVQRAKQQAAAYEGLSDKRVVPMFEIITTVALGEPSPNGNYTNEFDPELYRPWIERAGDEGIYVVLDLQPGRADLLDQAKKYESLLRHPHVGLAIDPEWKLRPDQRPLQQIGQVRADEVNRVGDWLATMTRENNLPQKLFVLHQFQTRMLPDRAQITTGHDELQTLIHVDGQGSQPAKQDTWRVILQDPPAKTVWGWKNFHDEDAPMLTPKQTMDQVDPVPVMISYQ